MLLTVGMMYFINNYVKYKSFRSKKAADVEASSSVADKKIVNQL